MGLKLTSYIQATDDSKRTYSPTKHSALSEIVSLFDLESGPPFDLRNHTAELCASATALHFGQPSRFLPVPFI